MEVMSSAEFQTKLIVQNNSSNHINRWLECHWGEVQRDPNGESDLFQQLAVPDSGEDSEEDENSGDDGEKEEGTAKGEDEECLEITQVLEGDDQDEAEEATPDPEAGLGSLDFIRFDGSNEEATSPSPALIATEFKSQKKSENLQEKKRKLRQSPSPSPSSQGPLKKAARPKSR
jgi:hypothetical protein